MVPHIIQTSAGQQLVYAQVAQPQMANILGPGGQLQQVQIMGGNSNIFGGFQTIGSLGGMSLVPQQQQQQQLTTVQAGTGATTTTFSTSTTASSVTTQPGDCLLYTSPSPRD